MTNHIFEPQPIRLINGREDTAPVYINGEAQPSPYTEILIAAAAVIGPTFDDENSLGLGEVVDRVGAIIIDQSGQGLIIEDAEGAGSVSIKADHTTVLMRRRGQAVVPTGLFFDMLYAWCEYKKGSPRSSQQQEGQPE